MGKAAGEAILRFLLFCAGLGLVRWSTVTRNTWQEEYSSAFEFDWVLWAGWIALLVGAGLVFGLACARRPAGYRVLVPLVVTLPALLLLGHFPLLYESIGPDGTDLPWVLGESYFYMDPAVQCVLAVVAGFGLAAGLRTPAPAAVSSTGGTEPPPAG